MLWTDRVGRRLKLRDLHIVLAVADAGSMGRASTRLGITQPSISKAIAAMEDAIGQRLFDRGSQGVEPTIYGQALLSCGAAVFDELRQGVRALEFLTDPAAGEVYIGSTESIAAGFVAAVIERLSRTHPRITFHLIPADRTTLLDRALRQRSIDFAVIGTAGLSSEGDFAVEVLLDDPFVVTVGRQSRFARRKAVELADLLEEPWVLPPEDSLPGRHIAETFQAAGLKPPKAQVISLSIPLHQHLLATGQFVSMLPASMMQLGRDLPLKQLPVRLRTSPYQTGIVTLKNRTLSPVATLFFEHARELAKAGSITP